MDNSSKKIPQTDGRGGQIYWSFATLHDNLRFAFTGGGHDYSQIPRKIDKKLGQLAQILVECGVTFGHYHRENRVLTLTVDHPPVDLGKALAYYTILVPLKLGKGVWYPFAVRLQERN